MRPAVRSSSWSSCGKRAWPLQSFRSPANVAPRSRCVPPSLRQYIPASPHRHECVSVRLLSNLQGLAWAIVKAPWGEPDSQARCALEIQRLTIGRTGLSVRRFSSIRQAFAVDDRAIVPQSPRVRNSSKPTVFGARVGGTVRPGTRIKRCRQGCRAGGKRCPNRCRTARRDLPRSSSVCRDLHLGHRSEADGQNAKSPGNIGAFRAAERWPAAICGELFKVAEAGLEPARPLRDTGF